MELAGDDWRSCVRLPSTDADCVIPWRNDWISILSHHAQVAVLQLEVNFLARAWFEMNPLKSAESDLRSAFYVRELEIDLDDFVSRDFAGVGNRRISVDRLP